MPTKNQLQKQLKKTKTQLASKSKGLRRAQKKIRTREKQLSSSEAKLQKGGDRFSRHVFGCC